ncbi:hypothetical protein [Hoeflea poritis]|uniref:Uncharacterized protein n=1 Tax=Hoeflea poritis TaxID=2993659 RepID=A0ABT4VNX0_9HYPH|nr:hypothetical protein [Hoeflea poritis]MDA4846407.1 hypothetical protein [Hoeflea poritis]
MRRRRLVVLAVAVRAGRVARIVFVDGKVKDWRISEGPAEATKAANTAMTKWLERFDPDIVVLENHHTAKRKAHKTRRIIKALYRVAKRSTVLVAQVTRAQDYPNKFVEAKSLAGRFPELKPLVPSRHRIWEREPRNLVCFEALALADQSGFLPPED